MLRLFLAGPTAAAQPLTLDSRSFREALRKSVLVFYYANDPPRKISPRLRGAKQPDQKPRNPETS